MKEKNNTILCIAIGAIAILLCLIIVFSILMSVKILKDNEITDNSSDVVTSAQSTTSGSISKEDVTVTPNQSNSSASSNNSVSVQKPVETSQYDISSEEIETVESQEDKSNWFKQVYSLAQSTYISELKLKKVPLESQKNELRSQREEYAIGKIYAQKKLMEQYANMGLLNSGQYTSALNNLNNSYNNKISALDNQISALTSSINEINAEINNPDPNQILAIVATNNNLTSSQVVEYYDKYMN